MIAIDWGTSSLRGARLDSTGLVLEEVTHPRGILTVEPGGFADLFDALFGHWMAEPGQICLMAGMVGSRQGWQEAPYCPCPAGLDEIARHLLWLEGGRIAIVAGLSCEHPGLDDTPALRTVPDVMRGEETQVLGALNRLGLSDARLVLPGTHSKWVEVRHGRILGFDTFMTGECYALLRQHSILARTLPSNDAPDDDEAFGLGVAVARQGRSLLQTAFSARTLALFERLPPVRLPDYLSGLVIGEELRARLDQNDDLPLVLIGADHLTRRYQQALALMGRSATRIGAQATWAGLHAIGLHTRP